MRIGTSFLAAVVLILTGVGLGTMFSEPKSDGKEAAKKNMEEAWAELLQPREEHKWLAEQAGEWNVEARMWKDGQEEPISLHGSATISRVFDRFIFEELSVGEGELQMKARGHMGYDSSNEEFNASYITSNCIAIHVLTGQRKDGTLELSGSWVEKGLDSTRVSQRVVCSVKDKDNHTTTIFARYGDGPEFKQLELTYTRKQ
ncbi:MAG: DUF1579 family protein [Planctomycetes bacterium]|nr:DUF1579 family protein [Planctomycetota bacterium]MCB9936181.1 DUF1579 family protein [Planctomycetota bacterium]